METKRINKRQLLRLAGIGTVVAGAAIALERIWRQPPMELLTVYTFGDSILDCGHYNSYGVHPGQLLVHNDDTLFPDFRNQDLNAYRTARLVHKARDGATVTGLPAQLRGVEADGPALALLTVGGNDMLRGLARDDGSGVQSFAAALDEWLRALPIRPVLIGNVYDPTFGDDARNFLGVDAATARANHRRVNDALASLAGRYGALVDLHAHFLKGDPSWYTHTIEPSLIGASEVRRAFLHQALVALGQTR